MRICLVNAMLVIGQISNCRSDAEVAVRIMDKAMMQAKKKKIRERFRVA